VGGWSPLFPFNYVGLLDEFRVYGRAITPAEVAQLYAPDVLAGPQRPPPGLLLLRPGARPRYQRRSCQHRGCAVGNDGTVSGTPGFAPLGRLGSAYDFKNSNW